MASTAPKFFCFVLMPFSSDFDEIYTYGIKESCKEADSFCERVDEQIYHETILERIYNQISKADLIIADMTGRNPNVFYEVGYAHALNKPVVLLTQDSNDIPFDLKHFPHIVYDKKIAIIREQLTKKITWFKNNRENSNQLSKGGLEIFVDNKNLLTNGVSHKYYSKYPSFDFTIYNGSPFTYRSGDFQIGIISEYFLNAKIGRGERVSPIGLPDEKYLLMLPFFDLIFPGAYDSRSIEFYGRGDELSEIDEMLITIKIYTDAGYREFDLKLKAIPSLSSSDF